MYKEPSFFLRRLGRDFWGHSHTSSYSRLFPVHKLGRRDSLYVCGCTDTLRLALTQPLGNLSNHRSMRLNPTNQPCSIKRMGSCCLFFSEPAWLTDSWIQAPAWWSEWRVPAWASSARLPPWRRSQRAGPPGWKRACGCLLCCPDGSLSQRARNQGGASPWRQSHDCKRQLSFAPLIASCPLTPVDRVETGEDAGVTAVFLACSFEKSRMAGESVRL